MALNQQIDFQLASIRTRDNLSTIAHSRFVRDLSSLPLPEIDAMVDLVSRVAPAGNVPGMILNGLARISSRQAIPQETIKRDINLLFRGVEQTLDTAVFGAFFAGPAAIIWAYQNLLKLAGKNPESAFPNGTWQFYVDYAMRDDSARHAHETHGFDTVLTQHNISINQADRMTAWVMAAVQILHRYDAILENEWRERVYTTHLQEVTRNLSNANYYASLYRLWEHQRPYARGRDVYPKDDYPAYRRKKFDAFIEEAMKPLAPSVRQLWLERINKAKNELPAYKKQLSLLQILEPDSYGETHLPLDITQANIGLIYRGHYHLVPICQFGMHSPPHITALRQQIATLVANPARWAAVSLKELATIRRSEFGRVREQLSLETRTALNQLRSAPILLNFDQQAPQLSLAAIRQGERGVGSHSLTVFDNGQTFVFDHSHIFFDGAWGAALAEIMSNEALAWAVYLNTLPPPFPESMRPESLSLTLTEQDQNAIQCASKISASVVAETTAVDLRVISRIRQLFKQRNDLLQLTINDLLLLYRAIHAATYEPSLELIDQLERLVARQYTQSAAQAALQALKDVQRRNPAILIPFDASRRSPRERLYPLSFEVPLAELNLWQLHTQAVAALESRNSRTAGAPQRFEELQLHYLGTLAAFGQLLSRVKAFAVTGKTDSVSSIKLLANLPKPLQHLLDGIPDRFAVINDIIKGREVFSNIGAVTPRSTLTRFMTAKDDNVHKTLCWGVLTDAQGIMTITLRDFRPHVGLLKEVNCPDVAQRITEEYLNSYAHNLNKFMRELQLIATAGRTFSSR